MEQALSTYLLATAGITSLVVSRIDWGLRPQGSARPALTLTLVSRVPVDSDEGKSGLSQSRVQIDCWAATMTGAKALAEAVKTALPGPYLALTGSTFHGLWTDNEFDRSPEIDKGGPLIFSVVLDFLIHHIE